MQNEEMVLGPPPGWHPCRRILFAEGKVVLDLVNGLWIVDGEERPEYPIPPELLAWYRDQTSLPDGTAGR